MKPDQEVNRPPEMLDEPPPFLRTWGRVYKVVVLYLAALIVLFYLFGKAYTP